MSTVRPLALFNSFCSACRVRRPHAVQPLLPDIDVDRLEALRTLELSDSSRLLLRLHWLAVTGGVHTAPDAIKTVVTGAHAMQLVSFLLNNGVTHLRTLRGQLAAWLEEHEYESLRQMQGSMNLVHCPDPKAFERANYTRILQGWEG